VKAAKWMRWCSASVASLLALLSGCASVPVTGRSQLNMVSDKQMVQAANRSHASYMAAQAKKNAIASPSDSPQMASYISAVQRVSDRIIDAAGLRGKYQWEVTVVKSKAVNAMVLPNGKIIVHSALLPVAKNDAGLAAVLGHEVAHVVARHTAERMSQVVLANAIVSGTSAALAASNNSNAAAISAAVGLGAQYGVLLPFSREHESEADRIGLLYMAKAGYDPAEAIAVWERMERAGGSGPWEFLSTHPSPATRRDQIRAWLPEAQIYYADRNRPLPANLAELQKARSERATAAALAPQALQPTLEHGTSLRYRVSNQPKDLTYTLDRITECGSTSCLTFRVDNGSTFVMTRELGIVEIRGADGSWRKFSPPLRPVRWPLRVGDSWTDSVSITSSTGNPVPAQAKTDVVSYEAVTVPAGSFMATKTVTSLNGVRYQERWYAPEARMFVRTITYASNGAPITGELAALPSEGASAASFGTR